MSKQLELLLSKDCPYEPWMFLAAKETLDWLMDNLDDSELNKLHVQTIMERVDYYLFHYFYLKSGLKPLYKCTIEELKAEIAIRETIKEDKR